jgi:hypothetical protein
VSVKNCRWYGHKKSDQCIAIGGRKGKLKVEILLREQEIENRLRQKVERAGGLALKFISPGAAGMPDRVVLLPGKRIFFVELKAPGADLRPLQLKRKEQLENLGFKVYVINSYNTINNFLQEVME